MVGWEDSALGCGLGAGLRMVGFVAEPAVVSVVPVSLLVSMVTEGLPENRGLLPLSTSVRLRTFSGPPRGGRPGWGWWKGEADGGDPPPVRRHGCVEEGRQGVCPGRWRGAASGQSKRYGRGPRPRTPILTLPRSSGSSEEVSLVVMEASSDYWKPFYYLLEEMPGSS